MTRVCSIIICAFFIIASDIPAAEIKIGDSREKVESILGKPKGTAGTGARKAHIYSGGWVRYSGDTVSSFKLKPGKSKPPASGANATTTDRTPPARTPPIRRPPLKRPPVSVAPLDDAYKSVSDCLFLVSTGKGTGSGFAVKLDGKKYIVTNEHVLRGAEKITVTTIGGREVKWTNIELADNRDLARLLLADQDAPALVAATGKSAIGDSVSVYGDSQGIGVITRNTGEIQGIGKDRIEISAKFVQGNSGGPILLENGRVVAVATYAVLQKKMHWIESDTRYAGVRRFGLTLAAPTDWKTVRLGTYAGQAAELIDARTFMICVYGVLSYYGSLADHGRGLHILALSDKAEDYKEHFSDRRWTQALVGFLSDRKQYVELNAWQKLIDENGSLKNGRTLYRKTYGKHFDADDFARQFKKSAADRDKSFEDLGKTPQEILSRSRWSTQRLEAEADLLQAAAKWLNDRIAEVMKLPGYRNEFIPPRP